MIVVNFKSSQNRSYLSPISILTEAINKGIIIHSHIWEPPTDVIETSDKILIRVEIAAIQETDFSITYDQNKLIIVGTRKEYMDERGAFHQMEIRFGDFQSIIDLPSPIDINLSEATYQDGLLLISLPKSSPKHIKITD